MTLPRVEGLRLENWMASSNEERLQSLQDLENGLAAGDGRQPCSVGYIPESEYRTESDRTNLRGSHQENSIYINERLVESDRPYMATETLFHEDRHDYQEHVAAHPELAESQEQLQDFQQNSGAGYLDPQLLGDDYYLAQPIEMDARATARERTEELYAGEFQDESLYPAHRAEMQAEEIRNREFCEDYLGENYEQVARETAYQRYEQHAQQQTDAVPELGQGAQIEQTAAYPGSARAEDHETVEANQPVAQAGTESEESVVSEQLGAAEAESPAEEMRPSADDTSSSQESGESQDYDYGLGY